MRVLIAAGGSHGDVLPFIALGREFAARGHEVILYANPYFSRYASDVSLRHVPVSTVDAYLRLLRESSGVAPRRALQRISQAAAEVGPLFYEAMKADARPGDTIAIGSSLVLAPRLLRETRGIPCAMVHLAPTVFRSSLAPPRLASRWVDARSPALAKRLAWWVIDTFYEPYFVEPLNDFRVRLGLRRLEQTFHSWAHDADCVAAMFPDWFAPPQADWPGHVVLTGFPLYDHGGVVPLPPKVAAFIAAGPPPVAFSAGTATITARAFYQTCADACRQAGLRGILLSQVPQQIPSQLPEGIVHVEYAPFSALLPKVAAFVHHGGIGSTSQALAAGVPQLIRPVGFDQFDNSARAVRLGVAREMLPGKYAAGAVAAALKELTADPALRRRCGDVAQRLAGSSSIAKTCDAILERCVPARGHLTAPAPVASQVA